VTIRLAERGIRVLLLDIEGTTTPIAFVHDVLFPYARSRVPVYLAAHRDDPGVREALARLRDETGHDAGNAAAAFQSLIDRDVKSPALKLLQGLIWEEGYKSGELRGQVFPDVAPSIRRWRDAGHRIAIYSSGSELAQRRLFESTDAGDLTSVFDGFFDTRVGAKIDASSYANIARELGCDPGDVLFVSDVTRELAAARQAGCQVVLSLRPGNPPQPDASAFESVSSFDEIATSKNR
jgi:enolase-phosphatase E1